MLYQTGAGVEPSPEKAEHWYAVAAESGSQDGQIGLVAVLLNAPAEARDYSRALYYLYVLGTARRPEAFQALQEVARNPELPGWVRERALYVLAALNATPVLDRLVADGAARRDGARWLPSN